MEKFPSPHPDHLVTGRRILPVQTSSFLGAKTGIRNTTAVHIPAEENSSLTNVGTMIPAGKVERGERKQTASEASKAD
jgi:hypothetical protein